MSDREAFEEAASRLGYRLKMADTWSGEYMAAETDTAWHLWQEACAWQAARAQGGEAVHQWREIGETDWMDCREEWKKKCDSSPLHDSRTLYTRPPKQQGGVPDGWREAVQRAVDELSIMDESEGIAGFHLNGDVSPWYEGELPAVRDELKALLSSSGPGDKGDMRCTRRNREKLLRIRGLPAAPDMGGEK